VGCFTAASENKKIQHGAFLLSTLPPHLTELSEVFQAGCFNFAQIKASVELCINKLSDDAAKSELKATCQKFDSELEELRLVWQTRTLDSLANSCMSSFRRAPNDWQIDHPRIQNGREDTGVNEPTTGASPCLAPRKRVCQDAVQMIQPQQDDTQRDFRRGRSTTEQISTFQQIFEKSWEHAKTYTVHMFCRPRESILPGSS